MIREAVFAYTDAMKHTAAIFDVDGVLVNSPHERAWRESLQQLMEGAWRPFADQTMYSPDAFSSAVYQEFLAGKPRAAGAKAALEHFGVPDPNGVRVQAYMDKKQTQITALIEQSAFTAFDDAIRLLLTFKEKGLKIAAASSSKNANMFLVRVNVGEFCQKHGLNYPFVSEGTTLVDLFDADVCGRDFAQGKPHPEIFLTAASELHIAPEQCVVIEDAQSGVQAAKAGGMACIGIARVNDEALLLAADADWVVTDLDDVPLHEVIGA